MRSQLLFDHEMEKNSVVGALGLPFFFFFNKNRVGLVLFWLGCGGGEIHAATGLRFLRLKKQRKQAG